MVAPGRASPGPRRAAAVSRGGASSSSDSVEPLATPGPLQDEARRIPGAPGDARAASLHATPPCSRTSPHLGTGQVIVISQCRPPAGHSGTGDPSGPARDCHGGEDGACTVARRARGATGCRGPHEVPGGRITWVRGSLGRRGGRGRSAAYGLLPADAPLRRGVVLDLDGAKPGDAVLGALEGALRQRRWLRSRCRRMSPAGRSRGGSGNVACSRGDHHLPAIETPRYDELIAGVRTAVLSLFSANTRCSAGIA